jgi:putative thiamine transport system permease protein
MAWSQRLLRWAPALTVATFALPIAAGLLGTLLPAFGYLPAIGTHGFGLQAWHTLFAHPGFAASLQVTLFTGVVSTVLSLLLALGLAAAVSHRAWAQRLSAAVAPVLATPHSALAIGFGFLIAPSGWLSALGVAKPNGLGAAP